MQNDMPSIIKNLLYLPSFISSMAPIFFQINTCLFVKLYTAVAWIRTDAWALTIVDVLHAGLSGLNSDNPSENIFSPAWRIILQAGYLSIAFRETAA
jgi:hypothetical protein